MRAWLALALLGLALAARGAAAQDGTSNSAPDTVGAPSGSTGLPSAHVGMPLVFTPAQAEAAAVRAAAAHNARSPTPAAPSAALAARSAAAENGTSDSAPDTVGAASGSIGLPSAHVCTPLVFTPEQAEAAAVRAAAAHNASAATPAAPAAPGVACPFGAGTFQRCAADGGIYVSVGGALRQFSGPGWLAAMVQEPADGNCAAIAACPKGPVIYPQNLAEIASYIEIGARARLPFPTDYGPTRCTDAPTTLMWHQDYRVEHGAGFLQWDPVIAASAQNWANQCTLSHTPSTNQWMYGENLAWGFGPGDWTGGGCAWAVALWYLQEQPLWRTSMGFSSATGHFTQLVWKGTRRVGCGSAWCDNVGAWYTYDPPGNILGQFGANVQMRSW
eukprot:scaffold11.g4064.t1